MAEAEVNRMGKIEKTIFISYRRTNIPWALAIFKYLTGQGYDVFFDYNSIASGDFEQIIITNIKARAHFIVLLTPSALERCDNPGDWLRREIETALETKRNIVPIMLEGFSFSSPSIARFLTGGLASLKQYNALQVPAEYFDAAMQRLSQDYLNIPLDAVLHPTSTESKQAAAQEQAAAIQAEPVSQNDLVAQEWFEKGNNVASPSEKISCYGQAIQLNPDFAEVYNNRGAIRRSLGDLQGAISDYDWSIALKPDNPFAYTNRGVARYYQGDIDGAIADYDQAILLDPNFAGPFNNRGVARLERFDISRALADFDHAISLDPKYALAYFYRGTIRQNYHGNPKGAVADYNRAIRYDPDNPKYFYHRGYANSEIGNYKKAIADLEKYLELGGGTINNNQHETEKRIRDFQDYLKKRPS